MAATVASYHVARRPSKPYDTLTLEHGAEWAKVDLLAMAVEAGIATFQVLMEEEVNQSLAPRGSIRLTAKSIAMVMTTERIAGDNGTQLSEGYRQKSENPHRYLM